MGKRHMTKDQILASMRTVKKMTLCGDRGSFTGMATLCNYILWKEEKWYQKKLVEYNAAVAVYDQKLDSGEVTLEQLTERLWNKADFKVQYEKQTEKDIQARKNSFLYEMEKRLIESNNTINEIATRYFLMHFNVLMDMGYGKKRLVRNSDYINHYLGNVVTKDGSRIMDLHRELIDKAGIYVEMPVIL